jgi:hypothetical protein
MATVHIVEGPSVRINFGEQEGHMLRAASETTPQPHG